eukprot:10681863-Lingulodinium_polyedra.AAC.1
MPRDNPDAPSPTRRRTPLWWAGNAPEEGGGRSANGVRWATNADSGGVGGGRGGPAAIFARCP